MQVVDQKLVFKTQVFKTDRVILLKSSYFQYDFLIHERP